MGPHLRPPLALLATLCTVFLAGCGSSTTGGGADDPDPAKAIPAGVAFYAEGVLDPDDDQSKAITALSRKVAKIDDPGKAIVDALEASGDGDDDVSYSKDIEPWLGKRAGVGVTSVDGRDGEYLGVAGVKDADKARAFVERTTDGKAKQVSGTDYWTDDDTLVAVKDDYLLLAGRVQDLKAGIDQLEDGKGSLADAKAFEDAADDLPDDRLGTFFVNTSALVSVLEKDPDVASSGGSGLIRQAFGGIRSVAGALTATESSAVVETRVLTDGKSSTLGLLGPGAAPGIVREAPADSIAVYGVPDVGGTLQRTLQTFGGAFGGAAVQSQASRIGLDLDRDVLSWLGDVAVFVRGTRLQQLDGALMIDAKDAAAAQAALPRLVAVAGRQGIPIEETRLPGAEQAWKLSAPGLPQPLVAARKGGRVALALGEDAARSALTPSATLDANGGYDRAKQATGGLDPAWLVDVQKVVGLVEQESGSDPGFQRAKPYLDALGIAVAGGKREGGSLVSRFAVTTAD